jgi:hypothetical protein
MRTDSKRADTSRHTRGSSLEFPPEHHAQRQEPNNPSLHQTQGGSINIRKIASEPVNFKRLHAITELQIPLITTNPLSVVHQPIKSSFTIKTYQFPSARKGRDQSPFTFRLTRRVHRRPIHFQQETSHGTDVEG